MNCKSITIAITQFYSNRTVRKWLVTGSVDLPVHVSNLNSCFFDSYFVYKGIGKCNRSGFSSVISGVFSTNWGASLILIPATLHFIVYQYWVLPVLFMPNVINK